MRNLTDSNVGGKTVFENRFSEPYNGGAAPFGSLITYKPINKNKGNLKFEQRTRTGLYVCPHLRANGWPSGDHFLIDLEDFTRADRKMSSSVASFLSR